jgi:hypothetical protein
MKSQSDGNPDQNWRLTQQKGNKTTRHDHIGNRDMLRLLGHFQLPGNRLGDRLDSAPAPKE